MNYIELIGSLAAVCTTVSFIPQVLLIIKTRNTDSISFSMYSVFITGVLLWTVYGIITHQRPLIIANIITFILAFIIWFSKISAIIKKKKA